MYGIYEYEILCLLICLFFYGKQAGPLGGEQRPEQGGKDKWVMVGLMWSTYMTDVYENVMMKPFFVPSLFFISNCKVIFALAVTLDLN